MKSLSFPQLLFASVGALLVWAAIRNETPAGVVRSALGTASPTPATGTNVAGPAPKYSAPGSYSTPADMSNPVNRNRNEF